MLGSYESVKKGFCLPRSDKVASPTTMKLSTAKTSSCIKRMHVKVNKKMTEVLYSQWSRMQCMVLGSGLGYIYVITKLQHEHLSIN